MTLNIRSFGFIRSLRIYLFVCRRYRQRLRAAAQRQSNNSQPDFTDEEVLKPEQSFGVYLFGLIKKRRTVSEIYDYMAEHFTPLSGRSPYARGSFAYDRRNFCHAHPLDDAGGDSAPL